ncbi:MAG: glycosyltransferase family 39 protein [Candidatus Eremiobacteraeota bacterium]|nr:glycosyltransferase family 39 protein [Candidatus Eremiobacteraeota bacterium]
MQKPGYVAFIGACIAALVTLPGLGSGTLWDNSETAYGEVAREILLYHDAVVMHLNGAVWFVQPPLYFWLAALFAKIFGIGTFALRLPAALATIAMGAMTGYAVERSAGARAGLYATMILSTSLMQAIVGRLAIMDALLDLAVAMTIFWWFRALQTGLARYFIFGWVATAFGVLAKGPVALVVALMVIVPFYFWNRRREPMTLPSWKTWCAGLALFALVVAPWPLMVFFRVGSGAIGELIGHYTIGRYTGTIENQAGPVWYYVPVLILGFFPWVAFFPAAIVYGINQLRRDAPNDGFDALIRLALVWIVVPFVFFSLAQTKLPNYIALEIPALAFIVALYFDSIVKRYRRRSLLISSAAIPVTIGCLAVAIVLFAHVNRLTADAQSVSGDLIAVGTVLFLGSIVTTLLFLSERTAVHAAQVLAASAAASIVLLGVVALPHAERFKPIPRLAAVIEARRQPGDRVAIQGVPGGNALVFYTEPGVVAVGASGDPHPAGATSAREVICAAERAFVVGSRRRPTDDPAFGRRRTVLAQDGNDALFLFDGPRCTQVSPRS